MFVDQVKRALDIFDRKFPGVTVIFLFDNAPSHRKYPADGLNVASMNVYPGGKQAIMRDTVWNDNIQKMVLPDGAPKGVKLLRQKCGIDVKDMTTDKVRHTLASIPDFSCQMTILEEVVCSKGIIFVVFPKLSLQVKSNRTKLVSRQENYMSVC